MKNIKNCSNEKRGRQCSWFEPNIWVQTISVTSRHWPSQQVTQFHGLLFEPTLTVLPPKKYFRYEGISNFETLFRPQVIDIVEYFLIRFCDSKPSNIDDLESLGSSLLKSWIIPFLNWNSKNQFNRLLSDMKAFKHIGVIITQFYKLLNEAGQGEDFPHLRSQKRNLLRQLYA